MIIGLTTKHLSIFLCLLGISLMIAELFVFSFGLLIVAGAVLILTSLTLILVSFHTLSFFSISLLIGLVALLSISFVCYVIYLGIKAIKQPVTTGPEALIGQTVFVTITKDGAKSTKINSELWEIESKYPLKNKQIVKIVDLNNLKLIVEPL